MMNAGNAYLIGQANCGIKKGDSVKVLRKARSLENGWNNGWVTAMDKTVGKVFTVLEDIGNNGIRLDTRGGRYLYPWFVLEVIGKAHTIEIDGKEINLSEESYQELRRQLL